MKGDNDVPYQPQHLKQKVIISFKSLKVLAAVLLIALVSEAGGYLLGTRSRLPASSKKSARALPTVTRAFPSSFSQGSEAQATTAADWKTYTSPYGYSVRYPSDMKYEEPGGYPFALRIKNEDFTMTFMLQTLRNDKTTVEEFANKSVCGNRPNDIKIKEEKINNVLIYRVEETVGNNKLCLRAVIGLNTFFIHPHGREQWILVIQSGDINRYHAKLFDDILSTVRFTQ